MPQREIEPLLPSPDFPTAFRYWLRLGLINFGGPAGQIAIMHRDLVERRRWISEERFLHALNFCMLLPGPEAQQLVIYIGWLLHGTAGGLVAGVLFVLPSVFVLLALSYTYAAWGTLPVVVAVLSGPKAAVVALVAEALLRIGHRAPRPLWRAAIAASAFVAIRVLKVPFPLIVLGSGLAGLAIARSRPQTPATTEVAESDRASKENDAPERPRPRAAAVFVTGALLWLIPLAALVALRGWGGLHTRIYLFFTQAALVTFGGAYAVLAYVTQAVVEDYRWLTQTQAIDGLALAETTPGPLIMVLQFVGFMAGWNHPEGLSRTSSALLGALATTYVTFLPCFVFIFIGAPYMERLRRHKRLTGALAGITAAVVGVIGHVALLFGSSVLWPHRSSGGIDAFALAVAALAFLALATARAPAHWVVAAGGLAGVARSLLA